MKEEKKEKKLASIELRALRLFQASSHGKPLRRGNRPTSSHATNAVFMHAHACIFIVPRFTFALSLLATRHLTAS